MASVPLAASRWFDVCLRAVVSIGGFVAAGGLRGCWTSWLPDLRLLVHCSDWRGWRMGSFEAKRYVPYGWLACHGARREVCRKYENDPLRVCAEGPHWVTNSENDSSSSIICHQHTLCAFVVVAWNDGPRDAVQPCLLGLHLHSRRLLFYCMAEGVVTDPRIRPGSTLGGEVGRTSAEHCIYVMTWWSVWHACPAGMLESGVASWGCSL
jgi:hypothetical protein